MISTIGWAKCNVASSIKLFIDSMQSMHLKTAWRSYFNVANTVERSFTVITESRNVLLNLAPKMQISQWCCIIITIIVFVIRTRTHFAKLFFSNKQSAAIFIFYLFFTCIQNCCQKEICKKKIDAEILREKWKSNTPPKRFLNWCYFFSQNEEKKFMNRDCIVLVPSDELKFVRSNWMWKGNAKSLNGAMN